MANTYKRIATVPSGGGGGGGGASYTSLFTLVTWGAPVGSYYTITILAVDHGAGTDPLVQLYETVGANVDQVEIDRIRVNASGDVEIRVPSSPDLRFEGKVVIIG